MPPKDDKLQIDIVMGLTKMFKGIAAADRALAQFAKKVNRTFGKGPLSPSGAFEKLSGDGPGGIGGVVSAVTKGAAQIALVPAKIVGEVARVIPYIGRTVSNLIGLATGLIQGLVNTIANIIGSVVNMVVGAVQAVTRMIGRLVDFVGKAAGWAVKKIGLIVAAVAAFQTAAVYMFAKLETKLTEVRTLTDMTAGQFRKVGYAIQEMSVQFAASSRDLAGGLYDIVSATFSMTGETLRSSDAMRVLRASGMVAKAGLVDVKVAADVVTTVLNSFGAAAEYAGRVADILFMIVKRGKTTMGELAPVLGRVASLGNAAGATFEELGAVLATLTRNGVRTEGAVTGLRAILSAIIAPAKEATETIEEMRKSHPDLRAEMTASSVRALGFITWLEEIVHAANGDIEVLAKLFPNIRALGNVAVLTGEKIRGLREDLEHMNKSQGEARKAFGKFTETIEYLFDKVGKEGRRIMERIGEAFAPLIVANLKLIGTALRLLFLVASPVLKKLGELLSRYIVPRIDACRERLVRWGKEIGPKWRDKLLKALPGIVWWFGKLGWRIERLVKRVSVFFEPDTWKWEKLKAEATSLWEDLEAGLAKWWKDINATGEGIWKDVVAWVEKAKAKFAELFGSFQGKGEKRQFVPGRLAEPLKAAWASMTEDIKTLLTGMGKDMKALWVTIAKDIDALFGGQIDSLRTKAKELLDKDIMPALERLQVALNSIADSLRKVGGAVDWVSEKWGHFKRGSQMAFDFAYKYAPFTEAGEAFGRLVTGGVGGGFDERMFPSLPGQPAFATAGAGGPTAVDNSVTNNVTAPIQVQVEGVLTEAFFIQQFLPMVERAMALGLLNVPNPKGQ